MKSKPSFAEVVSQVNNDNLRGHRTERKYVQLDRSLPGVLRDAAIEYDNKYPGRLCEINDERMYDGNAPFWIYTQPGWCVDPECHVGTAYDLKEALSVFKRIVPCLCDQCSKLREGDQS